MKRLIISISILLLLAPFSLVPTFAAENEESDTTKTNYVAELNKLGIAGRPESDNAAPFYEKAIELFVKKPESLKISTSGWPKEQPAQQQTLLKKWVQDNNRALEQIQLGSQKPYCWFKHTGQTLQKTEMLHLRTERQLAYVLQARAKLQAEDGKITNAINDIVTLYKFAAHIADGPKFLVEKLVGIAIKALPIRTAFNILDKKMVNANLMKSLEDRFKQLVTDYNEPFDIRSEKLSLQEQVETDPKYRFFKPYLNSTLEYYDTIAAKNTWQLHNEKTQSITEDNPLIETAGSGIPSVIEIEYRTRADEQALIITLAVLRYNADSGRYPATLPHLVSAGYLKELPIDPFSNKPLVYKQTRQGFTLYSFGADFDDDGGLHSKWGSGEEGGDQVFWPVEQPQMAERPSGRETPYSRTERPQRRATTFARSAAQPYLIEDDEEYVPARPRAGQETTTRSLHQAVVNGDVDQVKLLISKGADVNMQNRMGWTPLHTAIQNRRQAIVELLTTKGADVNAKDKRGQTPLYVAVNLGQKEVVELLIAKGADVNVMGSRGDNALSLAQKRRQTEIVDLLLKHGAKEPSPEDLMGDRYYEGYNPYPGYEEQGTIRRGTGVIRGTRTVSQSPVQVDILADPNEIKARIKTFEGLQKALEEVANKSQNEMRQWQQKRYDNRTLLIRTVQRQFEDEIGVIRKVAVEEKAKKTTETIDSTLSGRQERLKKVSKELLAQKRALRQMQQPTRGRGRTRTPSRGTGGRGRYPQRGQPYGGDMTEPLYGRGSVMPGTSRYPGTTRGPSEQIDIEAENEIRQWLQATIDNRADLANAVHGQIRVEFTSIRNVAVEEEAKKTKAAIDGLLLYRQMRFEEFFRKMEEEKRVLQQSQDPRIRGRMEQQNQPRPRGRRR